MSWSELKPAEILAAAATYPAWHVNGRYGPCLGSRKMIGSTKPPLRVHSFNSRYYCFPCARDMHECAMYELTTFLEKHLSREILVLPGLDSRVFLAHHSGIVQKSAPCQTVRSWTHQLLFHLVTTICFKVALALICISALF